jgi:MFS transporter, DHA2 family, multidrug resistance protein
MGDAAGLNSFIRQIGGSVGLTIFATMFTHFTTEAHGAIITHLSVLRPEVQDALKSTSIYHLARRAAEQSAALGFDRVFLLQGVLFVGVIPLLVFLRRDSAAQIAEHVDIAID